MSSLSKYLAENYLTASRNPHDPSDVRPVKKRKKNKSSTAPQSLVIDDDADISLMSHVGAQDDEDGLLQSNFGARATAEFRKAKTSAWKSVSADTGPDPAGDQSKNDQDADEVLRQAIADSDRNRATLEMENAPAIVETPDAGLTMNNGIRAGLQTAADTARMVAEEEERNRREEAEEEQRRKSKKTKKTGKASQKEGEEEETIYRDATGRRIDLSMRRAEAQRAEREKIAAEKKAREEAMGDVQLRQREERKQELEDAKFLTLGRSVDDEELNERQKEELRWDDPMAQYMAEKRAEEEVHEGHTQGPAGDLATGTRMKRKQYHGAAPPNRYGIKPGWRWDGVDRGNGFEKEWFSARNRRSRNENLSYEWQMDE